MAKSNLHNSRTSFDLNGKTYNYYRLAALKKPVSQKFPIYLIRLKYYLNPSYVNTMAMSSKTIMSKTLQNGGKMRNADAEVPFKPSRVILQDFTGVPVVVDLASLRSAMAAMGGDPNKINPEIPVDLVIDHSVQVDRYGTAYALNLNMELEFERNAERYQFLSWAQKAYDNYRAVPPATGIVHQVNLEYLANVVHAVENEDGTFETYPDTLVGTDSHTTMINGIGVLGWGVGGIEAEAGMLGQPSYFPIPEVIGVKFVGQLPNGTTATDLALKVTQTLTCTWRCW